VLQNFILEIEGKPAGRFFGFTGGTAKGEVVTEHSADSSRTRKHIASVKYQDMVLKCGTGMSRDFYEWLGGTFAGTPSRRTGAVIGLDHNQAPTARLDFRDALVISLSLPELDASSKDSAYLTVSISPESTFRSEPGTKAEMGVYVSALPKAWNAGNFRLKIDGFETECARVTHIDSLTLGRKLAEDNVGNFRTPIKVPTSVEFPNLYIRLPETSADKLYKWYEGFIVEGRSDEKSGSLEFFAPSLSQAYFGLDFTGLGPFQVTGSSGLRTKTSLPITFALYCESMKFYAGASAIM
jgi:phage tail-like protein